MGAIGKGWQHGSMSVRKAGRAAGNFARRFRSASVRACPGRPIFDDSELAKPQDDVAGTCQRRRAGEKRVGVNADVEPIAGV
jgi:hypothetical protein